MTQEQFEMSQKRILRDIHPELAKVLRSKAWEDGHAFGYDEVLNLLGYLIDDFDKINKLLWLKVQQYEL